MRAHLLNTYIHHTMPHSRHFIIISITMTALLCGVLWEHYRTATSDAYSPTAATLIQPTQALIPFTLLDTQQHTFNTEQLMHRWSLLFFGFTNCPHICPTTLATLTQVVQTLQTSPTTPPLQVIFITVDPQRDTPTQIATYLQTFNPDFIGLTGTTTALQTFTHALHVAVMPANQQDGSIDHSATLFLIDPQAHLHALFSAPHTTTALITDLQHIMGRNE